MTQDECPYEIRMLDRDEITCVCALRRTLSAHLGESPCFMIISPQTFHDWLIRAETGNSQLFAAFRNGEAIAFPEIADEGQNFASEAPDMKNICGAYCLPEYRGRGIMQGLLNYAIAEICKNGISCIGVDFESFNPAAYGLLFEIFHCV